MSSHYVFAEDLPSHGTGSKVWWSRNPTGHALVFVHGFKGTAIGTWSQFPSMLTREPAAAGWDLFFFGYDGQHTEMVSSASDVEALLDAMAASPGKVYTDSTAWLGSPRKHPEAYKRILVAAHSLGTVVSRRALLNGYQRTPHAPWAPITELVLYAPAHNGAKVMALVLETIGLLGPMLSAAQLFNKYIVLRDLKVGSPALNDLKTELIRDHDPSRTPTLRAREVVWARNDRIVSNATLYPDAPTLPTSILSGHTHSSVCKPTPSHTEPFDRLVGKM